MGHKSLWNKEIHPFYIFGDVKYLDKTTYFWYNTAIKRPKTLYINT